MPVVPIQEPELTRQEMTRHCFALAAIAAVLIAHSPKISAQAVQPFVKTLSVNEVEKISGDKNWVIVDTRSTDAYNGWKLDGIKRGGHLPGAVDFPAKWLEAQHEKKVEILKEALRVKGISSRRSIVLYGTDKHDRTRVARYLNSIGIKRLYEFDLSEWSNDAGKPLVRYKNYQLIVPPSIVKELLDGKLPESFEQSKDIKFVEASWGEAKASYLKGHVPRSFHVNTDHFEPPPSWHLGSPEILERFADQYGFQKDDTVIVSGEDPTASYRLAIVLRYMGVQDVRVLNGGTMAWKAAGYELETKSNRPPRSTEFGARIPMRPNLIDDLERVKAGLRVPNKFTLVDTRTWAEFTGETSGYKYHKHKGRIPGSIYGQAEFKGLNSLTPYRNIDHTMRNGNEILQLWKESGIETDKHLSFFCGGGWRAAEVLTFAQVIGLEKVSLYSDGWIGWSNDPNNKIETGSGVGKKAP